MNKANFSPPEKGEISLLDILLILAKNIKIIIVSPLLFCMVTLFYVLFIAKPVFTSSSKIMSSSSSSGGLSKAVGIAAQFGVNIPSGQSEQKWVYTEILQSRELSRAVLKQKFDTKEFGSKKSLLQILTFGNNKPILDINTLESIAVNKLLGMISINKDVETSVITLSVNASEPQLAAAINRKIIQELDAYRKKHSKQKAKKTKIFIEERILETEKELN